jgi:hypothetical protein
MSMPYRTSLNRLSEHDWHILSNTWARGVDHYVFKVGRRGWRILDTFGNFPIFKTKKAAEEAASNLLLAESAYRAAKRNGLPVHD